MMPDNTLMFTGTRWATARVVGTSELVFKVAAGGYAQKREAGAASQAARAGLTLFDVAASGHGRKWETAATLGFWRDFPGLPLDDAGAVLGFIRRYGDPYGGLDRGETTYTGHWRNLQAVLGTAAGAWEPAGLDGVSQASTDPKRFKLAEFFLRDDPAPILKDAEPALDPHGGARVVLRAKSLATFMCLSAASAIERRVPMRRCGHCASWMELNRANARFCSGTCRSLYSQQHKET